jgi:hypothetical protein
VLFVGDHQDLSELYYPETTPDNDTIYLEKKRMDSSTHGKFYPSPSTHKTLEKRNNSHGFGMASHSKLKPEIYAFAMDKKRCPLLLPKEAVDAWITKCRNRHAGYQSETLLKVFQDKPGKWTFEDLEKGRDYLEFDEWATEQDYDLPMHWPADVPHCHHSLREEFDMTAESPKTNNTGGLDTNILNRLMQMKQLQLLQSVAPQTAPAQVQHSQQPVGEKFFAKLMRALFCGTLQFEDELKAKLC